MYRSAATAGAELSLLAGGDDDALHRRQALVEIRLPSTVRAVVQEVGRDTIPEPVFKTPGKYLLRMGVNLEGDHSNANVTCPLVFEARGSN